MERKTCSICLEDSGYAPFHDSCRVSQLLGRVDELLEIVALVGKQILSGKAADLSIPLRTRIIKEMEGEEFVRMVKEGVEIELQRKDFSTDGLERIGVALGAGMEQPGGLCDGE